MLLHKSGALASPSRSERRPRTPPGGRARPDASIRALLLRCQDLQASRAFYSLLGCELTEERHGSGPLHYAFFSGELLVELYPSSPKHPPTRGLRLALQVNELHRRLGDLETHELLRQVIGRAPARPATLVRDPDDNILELEEADAASLEIPRPSVAS